MITRNQTKIKTVLTLAVVAMAPFAFTITPTQAALVIYEPFDYAAGDIDGSQAGGTGFSNSGWTTSGSTQFHSVITPGLTFTGLPTQGNALRRNDRQGNSETHRPISAASQTALTADNSTIWFSLLVDTETSYPKGNNLTFLFGTDAIDDPGATTPTIAGGGEGLGISFQLDTPASNQASLTALVVDDGTSSRSEGMIGPFTGDDLLFIAGKIDWAVNGSNDTLSVYNIVDPAAALPAPFATMTADLDQSLFDTLAIGDKQRAVVDEIRFGTTFADVMGVSSPTNISPEDGSTVDIGNVDLLWENMDPNNPDDPVYVDVWFGTDPDPKNGAKVVTAEPNVTSVTVDASVAGTYYWQVVNYINGPGHINEPNRIEGPVWSFNAADDLPPSSVDAGVDMMTWSGQAVSLDATVVDDGKSSLTYAWSANPSDGVVFDPNAAVEDPTVTITKQVVWAAVTVPNAGFEERETYNPFPESTDKYNQWANEYWRHFEVDNNGGPLRIWNPGVPGVDETPQGIADVGFGGNAPEGKYVVIVRSRYNDDEFHSPPQVRDFEAAVQLLDDETFNPVASYKLTAKVGRLPGSVNYDPSWYGYALQLVVGGTNSTTGAQYQRWVEGGTVIAEDPNTLTVDPNTFVTSTVVYTPDRANDHLAGLPMQIRLCALENPDDHSTTGWAAFDDVQLSVYTPTYTLTLAVNDENPNDPTPVEDTVRIDVYDNACQMARYGLGLSDITDIDENCITDIKDLATLLAKWLVDHALTAPVPKPL